MGRPMGRAVVFPMEYPTGILFITWGDGCLRARVPGACVWDVV